MTEWSPELIEKFWGVCCSVFDLRQAKLLEQKLRKGSGTESLLEYNSCHCGDQADLKQTCCGSEAHKHNQRDFLSPYCYRKAQNDTLGDLMQKTTHRKIFISYLMGEVAELAAGGYEQILKKATTELEIFKRQRAEIQRMCLSEAITEAVSRYISQDRSRSRQFDVKDGGLVAWPSSYVKMFPESPFARLDSLSSSHVSEMMAGSFAVVDNWMPSSVCRDIRKDVQWLEMHSLFDDMTPFSPNPHRTGYAMWLSGGDLTDDVKLPGVTYLLQKMSSLPFELNDKAKLCLTLSNEALIGIFLKDQYHRKHIDNSSSPSGDNGRSITCLFFSRSDDPELDSDVRTCDITLTIYDGEKIIASFEPRDNSAILFMTRDRPYSISDAKATKTLIVSHWCQGQKLG